jgi:hypothetical protein
MAKKIKVAFRSDCIFYGHLRFTYFKKAKNMQRFCGCGVVKPMLYG